MLSDGSSQSVVISGESGAGTHTYIHRHIHTDIQTFIFPDCVPQERLRALSYCWSSSRSCLGDLRTMVSDPCFFPPPLCNTSVCRGQYSTADPAVQPCHGGLWQCQDSSQQQQVTSTTSSCCSPTHTIPCHILCISYPVMSC